MSTHFDLCLSEKGCWILQWSSLRTFARLIFLVCLSPWDTRHLLNIVLYLHISWSPFRHQNSRQKGVKPWKSFWAMLLFYWVRVIGCKTIVCGWSYSLHSDTNGTRGIHISLKLLLLRVFFFQSTCEGGRLLALSGGYKYHWVSAELSVSPSFFTVLSSLAKGNIVDII